jgi:hypothetical protein
MDMVELEKRLTRMEDIEAIKQLKATYCDICDDDHNPDRITTIFAEDGIWEGTGFGKAQGHAAIRELFKKFQTLISFSQHQVMNPIITIDGERATGIWYFFGPFTFYKDNQAKWLAARYEDDYVKRNDEWKIQHLRARGRMSTDYEKSWAHTD